MYSLSLESEMYEKAKDMLLPGALHALHRGIKNAVTESRYC